MENEYNLGNDNYPTSVTIYYNFLFKWKVIPTPVPTKPPQIDEVTLTKKTTDEP